MEGTESEKVFEELNLNPQLFVNEVINRIDDTVDGAFEFFQQEALKLVTDDESNELRKNTSGDCLMEEDLLADAELDDQLNSVRENLHAAGKESAELQKELHGLKLQNSLGQKNSQLLRLCNHMNKILFMNCSKMLRATPTLHEKLAKMNAKRREEVERIGKEQSKGENFNALTYESTEEQYMMHQQSKVDFARNNFQMIFEFKTIGIFKWDYICLHLEYFTTDSNKVDEPFKVPEAETVHEPPPPTEKLPVLGGDGFVGSNICKEALDCGLFPERCHFGGKQFLFVCISVGHQVPCGPCHYAVSSKLHAWMAW
ncbi:hypothetical protein MKW92_044911, partial [Papaver armeniacum]